MVLPHRFVLRIRQVNTYIAAHLTVSGHRKCSKHVRYCSIDCLALSLSSHRCGLCLRTQPRHRATVPARLACGFWPVFLTAKSGFSSSWSFPGVLLSWEPSGAAWVWGRKGLWMKAEESHRCCCSHYNSRLATILAPRIDPDSARGKGLWALTPALPQRWSGGWNPVIQHSPPSCLHPTVRRGSWY